MNTSRALSITLVTRSTFATNPRLVKEATALREVGYQVRVLFGAHGGWPASFDEQLAQQVGVETTRVRFGPGTALPTRLRQVGLRLAGP